MRVNLSKCELLVFAPPSVRDTVCQEAEALRVQGNTIPMKSRVRHLGLSYGPGASFCACREEIAVSGRKATFALARALKDSRMLVPDIMLHVLLQRTSAIYIVLWGGGLGARGCSEAIRQNRLKDPVPVGM
jgi:hypothetical protein